MDRWAHAGISRVDIERVGNVIRFSIWTSRPGVVIGRGGSEIQVVKDELQKQTGSKIMINVQEIKNPDLVAQLVSESVSSALERRVSFRRAMKQAIFRAMKAGAKGLRFSVLVGLAVRKLLGGMYSEGQLPFHHSS